MRTLLTLFILMGCTSVWGQIDRYIQALEPSIMECEYDCTEQTDTLGTDVTTERVICKHSDKCTFYTLRFDCSFAAANTIKPQLL